MTSKSFPHTTSELEWLREGWKRQGEEIRALHIENSGLRAEVERLKAEIARLDNIINVDGVLETKAEVERLRAERQGWADTFAQNMKIIGEDHQRLRAAVDAYLENDSQSNWDRLAEQVGRDKEC